MNSELANQLSDGYANPNLPTASLRKDRCCSCRPTGGMGLEMVGLDGLAEVLERVTAAGLDELDRLTAGPSGHGGSAESSKMCGR